MWLDTWGRGFVTRTASKGTVLGSPRSVPGCSNERDESLRLHEMRNSDRTPECDPRRCDRSRVGQVLDRRSLGCSCSRI
jgi:hypothetical protein